MKEMPPTKVSENLGKAFTRPYAYTSTAGCTKSTWEVMNDLVPCTRLMVRRGFESKESGRCNTLESDYWGLFGNNSQKWGSFCEALLGQDQSSLVPVLLFCWYHERVGSITQKEMRKLCCDDICWCVYFKFYT